MFHRHRTSLVAPKNSLDPGNFLLRHIKTYTDEQKKKITIYKTRLQITQSSWCHFLATADLTTKLSSRSEKEKFITSVAEWGFKKGLTFSFVPPYCNSNVINQEPVHLNLCLTSFCTVSSNDEH